MWRFMYHILRAATCGAIGCVHGWMCFRVEDCIATRLLMVIGGLIGALVALFARVYRTSVWRVGYGMLVALGAVIFRYNVSSVDVDARVEERRASLNDVPRWWWDENNPLGRLLDTLIYASFIVVALLGVMAGIGLAAIIPSRPVDSAADAFFDEAARWLVMPLVGGMMGAVYAIVVVGLIWCWACRLNIVLGGLVGAYIAVLILWSMDTQDSAVPTWQLYSLVIVTQSTVGMVAGFGAAVAQVVMLGNRKDHELPK